MNDSKARILVVDDNLHNLKLLKDVLMAHDYQVHFATNGTDALLAVQAEPPDLILLDVKMPDIDGYEVCQRLKSNPSHQDIPVIFITVRDKLSDKMKAFSIGGVDYLTKPFEAEEVIARVKTHLTINTLKRQLKKANETLEEKVRSRTEELRKSENRLKNVLETLPLGVWFTDTKGKIVYGNPAGQSIWQGARYVEPGEFHEYKAWWRNTGEMITPEEWGVSRALRNKESSHEEEIEIECFDGTHKIILNWATPLLNSNGEVCGALAVNQDVSDRKMAEGALKESEERFELAMKFANEGLYDWDLKTNEIYYSPGWKRLIGYEDEEIKNEFSEWERLTKPEDVKASWTMLNEILDGKRDHFEQEFQMLHKDGHWIDILSRANVVFDEDGKGIRVLGTHVDITERRLAEEALRKSEEYLDAFLNNSPIGFAIWDREFRYVFINDVLQKINGPSLEEHIGRTVQEVLPKAAPIIIPLFEKILYNCKSFRNIELSGEIPSTPGKITDYLVSYFPISVIDGHPQFIGGIVVDITERKKAEKERKELEDQLQQAQKMESIGTLAGGIAHDFNNILGIILGNAELAMDDMPEWNPASQNLDEVKKACMRAKDVVRQILSFSRKSEVEQKSINIASVVAESLKLSRASIPTSIEIRQNIANDVDDILGDPTQIHQVMINLCGNAAHAMEKDGGILEITLRNTEIDEDTASQYPELNPGPHVHLGVSDTGDGINPEVIDRVFDPYFTTKDVGKGTGMGLAVVHGIVKSHHGSILVESELGKGTTFKILFPSVKEKSKAEQKESQELPTGNESILFVDDEASMVNLNQQRLEKLGYKVIPKTDPSEALEFLRTNTDQINLVITDMTMPKMTGDKLAQEILKIRPDIPIIICTGYSERMSEDRAQEIGIHKYIEKPIEKETLARSVREVLDGK